VFKYNRKAIAAKARSEGSVEQTCESMDKNTGLTRRGASERTGRTLRAKSPYSIKGCEAVDPAKPLHGSN